MPRISNVFRRLFPLSLPSLNSYIAFSAFLFGVGLYYSYRIAKLENNILQSGGHFEKSDDGSFANEYNLPTVLFLNFTAPMRRHRFLFYVMINTCCAVICLLGKSLILLMFGALSNQEDSALRKFFRRFVSAKLTFLVFISQHNLFEDISIWTPWLGLQALCLFLLELANLRLANAQNVISNNSVRQRLFVTSSIICVSSLLMLFFVFGIKNYINLSYCLFLAADCSLLLLQSMHLLLKLSMLVDANAQRSHHSSSAHYFDLAYEMVRDCLEFANYLHMIFYSQLAITYCCVFLVVQAQHYYRRISGKIRKYLQQKELMRHINSNYETATEEDLLKNDQCTICWQPMKSARKLPCAHIFHEHCLRRWLEQDSSCAICRKTLALNLTRPQQNIAGIEDNGLQVFLEAFSPQNNRFARWWMRYLFEPFNDEQTAAMVNQVSEMFPQIPIETIRNLINTTGSPTVAIELLLGRNGQNEEIVENDALQNQQLNLNGEIVDSSDDSSETVEDGLGFESETNQQNVVGAEQQNQQMHTSSADDHTVLRLPFGLKINNSSLEQKMHELLMSNRRKYLDSTRALSFHD
ncbi:hypothetical protein niasHS_003554 [Heterodera schachtii]|uniref:E3 ubiquitin-protein ligase AMFR n=1 Tax=Heterodera schachtii TaxID=97005 RepID=A0ABD2KHL2_HETSC